MPRHTFSIPPSAGRKPIPTLRAQGGFSLIEVLVSVFVFSLGLVGMLSLSVATLENNKAAQLRMTGVGLVNDYAERVRMNIRAYDAGLYAIALENEAAATTVVTSPSETKATAATSMANADKQSLLREVAWRLPQGDAVVKVQATSASRAMHVWLLWQEPTAATGSVAAALFAETQQTCPGDLSTANKAKYSCMYFMVTL